MQFGRELILNLTQYGQDMEWVKSIINATSITIPNLEFVVTHVNELGRLHKIVKDYVNIVNEHNGCVAKVLKLCLQEKMNSYYVYVNKWVRNIFVLNNQQDPGCLCFYILSVTCQH